MSQSPRHPQSSGSEEQFTNTSTPTTVGILGMGAIGTLMAWHWRDLLTSQRLYALKPEADVITRQFSQLDGSVDVIELPIWSPQNDPLCPELDWLVVTTKATHTLAALKPWSACLSTVKRILLLQNGMGQQQEVEQWLAQQQLSCEVWLGISTEGAFRPKPQQVVYAGAGSTWIGPASEHSIPPESLPGQLQLVTDIHQRQREKLAINAVINPLTGQLRCRNGELVTNMEYRQQLIQLAEEVQTLYDRMGWTLAMPLVERSQQVAEATGHNRSSTLQDILAGRPTELAYICGYLLAVARAEELPMPLTEHLFQALN